MFFPVVMYGCESWTIKKAERQRIDAFELWCWRTSLVVQWFSAYHSGAQVQSLAVELRYHMPRDVAKKKTNLKQNHTELWCWRRLLSVPWTARGSNQSILKGVSPEYSLEGPMVKLKLQYFGHLI